LTVWGEWTRKAMLLFVEPDDASSASLDAEELDMAKSRN
jgi:hypothetical protein